MSAHLPSPERVLPTLNADGTRNRIRPKPYAGRYVGRRAVLGWALIALFVVLPFIEVGGQPALLFDVNARKFHLFGATFLATDGVLLMLLLLSIFVGIFLLSAVLGRAWCGWGCPQTVYMEFLFRPIERLFEGNRTQQLKLDKEGGLPLRRLLKNVTFAVLSVVLANVFLSYFVGVATLRRWVLESPLQHPGGFAVMAVTALMVFADFAWFREQMCTVACPYARLQAVILDKHSLIIGYDARRGEPRGHGKDRQGKGDCIDCNACVVTCPTGIDIRQGLQLECVACAQCVDACDSVMDKVGKPRGLIRYASQATLEQGTASWLLRPRVLIYAVVVTVLVGALVTIATRMGTADVTVLRGLSSPFVVLDQGIQNQLRIKVENRSGATQKYAVELVGAPGARLISPQLPLEVPSGSRREATVFVLAPRELFANGVRPVKLRVTDGASFDRQYEHTLLGPTDAAAAAPPHAP